MREAKMTTELDLRVLSDRAYHESHAEEERLVRNMIEYGAQDLIEDEGIPRDRALRLAFSRGVMVGRKQAQLEEAWREWRRKHGE